ncbi:hypothetical protein ACTHGU_21690 [Chitinophagaceae bacterium MMS25-I14]
MKKLWAALLLGITFSHGAQAQNVRTSSVSFKANKMEGSYSAVVADYDYDSKAVEAALSEKLASQTGKGSNSKGYRYFQAVTVPELTQDKVDLYYKVESEKGKAVVTMLISKGYDNFITPEKDPTTFDNMKQFLVSTLPAQVKQHNLMLDIARQEEIVKNAEKKYGNSVDDGKKLQRQIDDNTAQQTSLKSTVEAEKAKLDDMRKQMAPGN